MEEMGLNPLSTGKSVQTKAFSAADAISKVLIPYLQGSLFRLESRFCGFICEGLNPLSTGKSVQTLVGVEQIPTSMS